MATRWSRRLEERRKEGAGGKGAVAVADWEPARSTSLWGAHLARRTHSWFALLWHTGPRGRAPGKSSLPARSGEPLPPPRCPAAGSGRRASLNSPASSARSRAGLTRRLCCQATLPRGCRARGASAGRVHVPRFRLEDTEVPGAKLPCPGRAAQLWSPRGAN